MMKNLMLPVVMVLILAQASGLWGQNAGNDPAPAPPPGETAPADPPPGGAPPGREAGLKLNFRDVPLETVLDYLSEAAGFIIVLDTEVTGKVTAWSHQPVTKDEAVELLNTVLFAKGFAVVRNGRTLMIVNRDEARTRNIPVMSGNKPEQIPSTDIMVTQIIPVRSVDVRQLSETLQPLLGEHATLSANESSNALILTDSQRNIRRIVQIVEALDQSITGISTIRVFQLKYGNAAEAATLIKELFDGSGGSAANSRGGGGGNSGRPDIRAIMQARFGGGDEGRGGDRERGRGGDRERGGRNGGGESAAREAGSRVVAVADERSNSVVVGAPEDTMSMIEQLIQEIDQNVTDMTEIRVFKLLHSDPVELAEIFNQLFQNEQATQNERGRGPGFFFGGGGRRGGGDENEAGGLRADEKVVAVPDPRTTSLIVSASRQMMPQIEAMVEKLDSSNAKQQKVFVYTLDHADVNKVSEMLRGMFEGESTRNSTATGAAEANALSTRSGGFGNAGATGNTTGGGGTRGAGGGGGGFGR